MSSYGSASVAISPNEVAGSAGTPHVIGAPTPNAITSEFDAWLQAFNPFATPTQNSNVIRYFDTAAPVFGGPGAQIPTPNLTAPSSLLAIGGAVLIVGIGIALYEMSSGRS